MKKMKALVCAAGIVAALLPLIGCMGVNTPNIPSFVTSDNLIRIEVTNDQVGQKGLASKAGDNLNELLNMLHLGDITASSRIDVPEPTASAYSLVAYDTTQFVWTIRVLDSPESSRVYLRDAVHPTNNGIYPLKQPIRIDDLNQFVRKYPAP